MRTLILNFRARPDELEIVNRLAQQLGCNRSDVFRHLLRAASNAQPATVNVNLDKANGHSATTRQSQRATPVVA